MIKMSGAGNTFVFMTEQEASAYEAETRKPTSKMSQLQTRSQWVSYVCDPVFGVKADGVVILENATGDADLVWDFYNADGSRAEMCGNAARCAYVYAVNHMNLVKQSIRLKTTAGVVLLAQTPKGVSVKMPLIKVENPMMTLRMQGSAMSFSLLNTGVPHLVTEVSGELGTPEQRQWCAEARKHSDVGPKGANVTLWQIADGKSAIKKIKAVTFERGVEDFTLACGTGAVAAAHVAARKMNLHEVEVAMPGGLLSIDFQHSLYEPMMSGPAIECVNFQFINN